MTQPLHDTWAPRDLPVLVKIAGHLDQTPGDSLAVTDLIAQCADIMEPDDVTRAVIALSDAGHIGTIVADRRLASAKGNQVNRITRISPDARRLVGLWPTPESALDRMIATLERIESTSDDPDERGRARKILDGFIVGGRDLGVAVMAAAINQQVGLNGG